MKIIGITGRSGCGKSTVSAHYRKLGYLVADADLVAREIMEPPSPCLKALAEEFGADVVQNGVLNRPLLAERAFSRKDGSQRLVEITHPEIIRRLLAQAEDARRQGHSLFFVDGAVIVGAPFQAYCDGIVVVTAPHEACVQRICNRDGLTVQQAERRLASQLSEEQLLAASMAQIVNDGSLEQLIGQVDEVLEQLKGGLA